MELRHLRYFTAVAEAQNVSRAALRLHVSQPALSRQIRDLEQELGYPLFERTPKSVRLTEAGKVFWAEARSVLQRAAEAVEKARLTANGTEIHVGYAPSPMARLMPPTLRAFQAQSPVTRVKLHDLSTEEMLTGVREGKLQIAFLVRPARALLRGLRFEELARDPMCLAVPPTHPFARLRSVPLARVAQEKLVIFDRKDYPEYLDYLEDLFASIKPRFRVAEEHESASSLIAAIESGAGLAVVPRSFSCSAGPRLKLIRLMPAPKPIILGAAFPRHGNTLAAERLWKTAESAALKVDWQ